MRTDRNVEGFGQMRRFQPRRDTADAYNIDLNDACRAGLQVILELAD